MIITVSSTLSLQAKQGLPTLNKWGGWIVLGISPLVCRKEIVLIEFDSRLVYSAILAQKWHSYEAFQDPNVFLRLCTLFHYPFYRC